MTQTPLYADLILPLAIPNYLTYAVSSDMQAHIQAGMRVLVSVKNKKYSALVRSLHQIKPSYQVKFIEEIIDEKPIVTEEQFAWWEWICKYYLCYPGEVMVNALPAGLRLSSETKILMNPYFDGQTEQLSDEEFLIVEALQMQKSLSLGDIAAILNKKKTYNIIRSLIAHRVILVEEEVVEKYRAKKETYIQLSPEANGEETLRAIFDELVKADKQLTALMAYIKLSGRYTKTQNNVIKRDLVKECGSASAVDTLIKKGIFELHEEEVWRIGKSPTLENPQPELSPNQQEALNQIKAQFADKQVVLLHGVTSSGKTEIYVKLIEEQIKMGKKVLYLLPEIALTTQLIERLKKFFQNKVGVYHSRFNQHERVEIWNRAAMQGDESFSLIIGARSASFLPISNLGLIIIDEEHDQSFKQQDPAPRYNGRDAAIVKAIMQGAKVLLGSATPSYESYYNARQGKYGLVSLNERYGGQILPDIQISDLRLAMKNNQMRSHLGPELYAEMKNRLQKKEQIILFQNRRGFSPMMQCDTCGWIGRCTNCDISLTYHKQAHLLKCHYCGHIEKPHQHCPSCGSAKINMKGFGTEKVEEELGVLFPDARIARLDWDSTRKKDSFREIIQSFENREIDILVGTQMVTKGLDFENVSLVGILLADQMLNYPDFRAYERAYQLMSQVAGRAGRRQQRGKVIIQTFQAQNKVVEFVKLHDFHNLYVTQMQERQVFQYPPYTKLISIILKHKEVELVNEVSKQLAVSLKASLGKSVIGPEFPAVARIKNQYIKNILIKVNKKLSFEKVKAFVNDSVNKLQLNKDFRKVRIIIDVDPY